MKKRIRQLILLTAAFASAILLTPLSSQAASLLPSDRAMELIGTANTAPAAKADLKYSEIPVKSFRVSNLSPDVTTALDYTDWWFSEWEDCRYVFLPATADREKLVINYSAGDTLSLNGKPVESGKETSILSEADTFEVSVGGKDCGTLKIMQSNLGCIYLSTSKGGLDALDNNRYLTETGSVLMLNSDGGTEYSGEIEKLTAHGNTSWDYSMKKPYNLKLPKKADLYGMGKAKKWVLLSNYIDHTMLRNKLTEDMCKTAGMECVMDSVFVDLYADGSYRGTYQLSEKVQIQKKRVNIRDLEEETEKLNSHDLDEYPQKVSGAKNAEEYMENSYKYFDIPNDPDDITGGYLMQFQQWNRYGTKCVSGFVTSRGQAVGIDGPKYASKAQAEYIRSFVQDAEDAVYSENGFNSKGKHFSDYIDMYSLVKAYLVQEISKNIDATSSSFYLWKDSDKTGDGKLHFSPAWDFDLAYCNFATSRRNSDGKTGYSASCNNLFAAYFPIHGYDDGGISSSSGSGRPTVGISWVGQLYKNEDFVNQAAKTYFSDFKPYLDSLTKGENTYIQQLAENILPSAEMNNARWHMYGGAPYAVFTATTSGASFTDSARLVSEFIGKRSDWLSSYWEPCTYLRGDVNADGIFSIADAVSLKNWLLAMPDSQLEHWQAGDLCKDDRLDIYDFCIMKNELLGKS